MKTGLFFGSFNPIHIGHLIIANYMAENTDLNEVWLVVTPHNPHKKKSSLAKDHDRLHLVHIACEDNDRLRASDIEFNLPKPSYTVDTLAFLREKYPKREFSLIMGGDNLTTFHKWKNHEVILKHHDIHVYNRPGNTKNELAERSNVYFHDAPLLDISATKIRKAIKDGISIRYLVHDKVFEYLENSTMYKS